MTAKSITPKNKRSTKGKKSGDVMIGNGFRERGDVKKGAAGHVDEARSVNDEKISGVALIITAVMLVVIVIISNVKSAPSKKDIRAQVVAVMEDDDRLHMPFGIALNKNLYISNIGADNFVKFTPDRNNTFVFAGSYGDTGLEPGKFDQPSGITLDNSGNVYIADAHNNRIQKFSANGAYMMRIDYPSKGFWRPRNVMAAKDGNIYVADTGKSNLYRFDAKGMINMDPIKFPGEIFGLAEDSSGRIYVASLGDRAVVVFDGNMRQVKKIKIASWISGKNLSPMIAIDSHDRLYAVSEMENSIFVYDTRSDKFPLIGEIFKDTEGKYIFSSPLGIAVDPGDDVYVTDRLTNKVFKIRPVFK